MTKGEQTRQTILSEAAKLFNQRGYEGSSLLDVMEATGLEKGGIYRHFSSKEELAGEAFDYAWNAALELRTHDIDDIRNSLDKLRKLITNFVERRPTIPGGCPLLNTAIDADDGNPALRKRAGKALQEWKTTLTRIVQAGIQRKEIRPATNPAEVANVIIAGLEGALMISRLERKPDALLNAQAHLEAYLDSLVRV